MANKINIYTDGAAQGNPGRGGYGIILHSGSHYKEASQGFRLTTNNRMELLAVIVALEMLRNPGNEVHIYTDSKYVVDPVEKGWLFNWQKINFKQKKNKDLWLRFLKIYPKNKVKLHWIKGHNDHPQNERCDELAVQAANESNLLVDQIYESLDPNNKLSL